MNNPVGYLINHNGALQGARGLYYQYIFGSNGVFIEAENKWLIARIPVAECAIRGLSPVEPQAILRYGKIPSCFFDLALNECLKTPDKEKYLAITYNNGYHLFSPNQDNHEAKVKYETVEGTVMDIHSHGDMQSRFSDQDCSDEQGFVLSCVIGELTKTPVVKVRMCVYGSFWNLNWRDVFEGTLTGATEEEPSDETIEEWEKDFALRLDRATNILKERNVELQGEREANRIHNRGRHWWDRLAGMRRLV